MCMEMNELIGQGGRERERLYVDYWIDGVGMNHDMHMVIIDQWSVGGQLRFSRRMDEQNIN